MKVCIYGAGVIGGVLAAACAKAGHHVSAIARGPHLQAMQNKGLKLVGPDGETLVRLKADANPAALGVQDVVFVCTKTPSLPDVARAIAPLLGEHTQVGFSVNGVLWFYEHLFAPGAIPAGVKIDCSRLDPDGLLHDRIGPQRSFGAIAWAGGEIAEPGVVHLSRAGGTYSFGAAMPQNAPRIEALTRELALDTLDVDDAADLRPAMWRKYMSVVANFAVCSLTGANIGQLHADKAAQEILLSLMGEAAAVAHAHGVSDVAFDKDKLRANPVRSAHKPSMLQDLERGRVMEIDSAFLVLQDLARGANVSTPVLDTLAPLLQMRARIAGCYTG